MPILARFTNFGDFHDLRKAVADFHDLRKAVATALRTVNLEINFFLFLFVQKFLFSSDTNLRLQKLNLGSKLKDFSVMLDEVAVKWWILKYFSTNLVRLLTLFFF